MAGFFGFFDFTKPGPGVSKDAPKKRKFFLFFDVFWRKLWQLMKLNMLYLVCALPMMVIAFFLSGVFPVLQGNGEEALLYEQLDIFIRITFAVGVVTLIGIGPASCGFSYVLRNYSKESHSWMWSDFWEHSFKNLKQAFVVFIIDIVAVFIMLTNIKFYLNMDWSILSTLMSTLFFLIVLIYVIMHKYIYVLMLTYQLTIKQIYKNALIFAIVRLPSNVFMLLLNVIIILLFCVATLLYPLAGLLVILLLFSFVGLMNMFHGYGHIEYYMSEKSDNTQGVIESDFTD